MIQEDSLSKQPSKVATMQELLDGHAGLYNFLEARAEEEDMSVESLVVQLIATYRKWVDDDVAEREQLELQGEIVPTPEGIDSKQLRQKARDFLEALVDKDFERAYTVARTRFYEWVEQDDTYSNVVRIITVGEPFRRNRRYAGRRYADDKGVHIPFEVELADGKIRRAFINIRWDNPEGEWVFDGGL